MALLLLDMEYGRSFLEVTIVKEQDVRRNMANDLLSNIRSAHHFKILFEMFCTVGTFATSWKLKCTVLIFWD